eukprot:scaffold247894_cov27-Tisochrysis_lutea.AAC.1
MKTLVHMISPPPHTSPRCHCLRTSEGERASNERHVSASASARSFAQTCVPTSIYKRASLSYL